MKRILNYTITEQDAGKSVTDFLRSRGFSRHLLIVIKQASSASPDCSDKDIKPLVLVNHQAVRMNTLLVSGDTVQAELPEEASSEHIPPVRLPLDIIYEDEDLLVLNKPYDMPIHPSIGNYENTLANALAWYYQEKGESFIFRCINRLDRDTSGLLIVAKNALSGAILSDQMKRREIHREYISVVKGIAPERGVIDAPIARANDSVIERCVDLEHGEHAVTHFQRLATARVSDTAIDTGHTASSASDNNRTYSLLSVHLETGRTHQIRVHMNHIGHPLPGDFLYYPDYTDFKRQPLHSRCLKFKHPITGENLQFESDVPEDFHPEFFKQSHII